MDNGNNEYTMSSQYKRDLRRLQQVKEYIQNNYSSNLKAAIIAKEIGLSVSTLLHLFKKYNPLTFQQYTAQIRMKAAFEILKRGGSVKEAMYSSGYKYRSTFNKAFKKAFHVPPGYFRK